MIIHVGQARFEYFNDGKEGPRNGHRKVNYQLSCRLFADWDLDNLATDRQLGPKYLWQFKWYFCNCVCVCVCVCEMYWCQVVSCLVGFTPGEVFSFTLLGPNCLPWKMDNCPGLNLPRIQWSWLKCWKIFPNWWKWWQSTDFTSGDPCKGGLATTWQKQVF